MTFGRGRLFAKCILPLRLGGVLSVCHATPLIVLTAGQITRLNYAGQELFIDSNGNKRADAGDVFEGVVSINQILSTTSGADFSSQLADS